MKKLALYFSLPLMMTLLSCSEDTTNDAATGQETSIDTHTATAPPATPGLPSFTVQDINGKVLNLQSLKGKKVFLNLWASWCPPCRAEIPSIAKLRRSVDSNKVVFVMLALDDRFEKAKKFVQSRKLDLPIFYPTENLPSLLNVDGIPATFIFNEEGNLVRRVDGGDLYDTKEYRTLLQ
jgi:thiol-disulfide isomerase/thioredoxin